MKPPPNLEILPLAAVGLVLVLIMMVVSPLVVSRNGTPVNLPQTHTAERKTENDINITYTSEGKLVLDDEPVASYEELENLLENALIKDPYMLVVVRADKECLHSHVLDILATARHAGALRIACATKMLNKG